MLQLYVVPCELHGRVTAFNEGLYASLGNAEKLEEHFSLLDLVQMTIAQSRFPFTFEESLGITMGKTPLEVCGEELQSELLAEKIKSEVQLQALKDSKSGEKILYTYELVPVGNDVWVVVEQRVHGEQCYPNDNPVTINEKFFDQLISKIHANIQFHDLVKTELFTNYLKASRK